MNMRMFLALAAALLLSTAVMPTADADGIDPSYSYSYSYTENDTGSDDDFAETLVPSWDLVTGASHEGSTADTTTAVTMSSIDFTGDVTLGDGDDPYGSTEAYVNFTIDTGGEWVFDLDGAADGDGDGTFIAYLYDYDAGEYLFAYDSDVDGDFEGATGSLTDEGVYELYYFASMMGTAGDEGAAWLSFDVSRPVPEPGTLALLGLGLGGVFFARRRKARA